MPTVTECKLMDGHPKWTQDGSLKSTWNATYKIHTDDPEFRNQNLIRAQAQATGPHKLPQSGAIFRDPYGTVDPGAFCQKIKLSPSAKCRDMWFAMVEWKPLPSGKRPSDVDPNIHPLDRPKREWLEAVTETTQISKGWNQIELPRAGANYQSRAKDTEGPVVNAAGESYDEALYEDETYDIYVQQKNVANPSAAYALRNEFGRSLNEGQFLVFDEDCAKFLSAETGEPQSEQYGDTLVEYYVMQVRIAVRSDPWYVDVVNRGYNEVLENSSTGSRELHEIKVKESEDNENEVAPSEPVLLSVNGTALGSELGNTIPYRTRRRVPYGGLVL